MGAGDQRRRVRSPGRGPDRQGHPAQPADAAVHQRVLELRLLRPADGEPGDLYAQRRGDAHDHLRRYPDFPLHGLRRCPGSGGPGLPGGGRHQRRLLQHLHGPAHRHRGLPGQSHQQRRRILRHRLPGGRHRHPGHARREDQRGPGLYPGRRHRLCDPGDPEHHRRQQGPGLHRRHLPLYLCVQRPPYHRKYRGRRGRAVHHRGRLSLHRLHRHAAGGPGDRGHRRHRHRPGPGGPLRQQPLRRLLYRRPAPRSRGQHGHPDPHRQQRLGGGAVRRGRAVLPGGERLRGLRPAQRREPPHRRGRQGRRHRGVLHHRRTQVRPLHRRLHDPGGPADDRTGLRHGAVPGRRRLHHPGRHRAG